MAITFGLHFVIKTTISHSLFSFLLLPRFFHFLSTMSSRILHSEGFSSSKVNIDRFKSPFQWYCLNIDSLNLNTYKVDLCYFFPIV